MGVTRPEEVMTGNAGAGATERQEIGAKTCKKEKMSYEG